MQTAVVCTAHWTPAQVAPKRRSLRMGRAAAAPPRAAAPSSSTSTDLGAMLNDAITAPAAAAAKAPAISVPSPAPAVQPVPGLETFAAPAPAGPPPVPTQGMDLVLQKLQSKPPGFDSAAKAAGTSLKAAEQGAAGAAADAGKGLASAADVVQGAAAGAAKSLSEAVGGVVGGASDVAGGASAAAAAASAQASTALQGATSGLVGAAQQFADSALAEYNTEVGIVSSNVTSLVGGITSAVEGATSSVTTQVSGAVGGVTQQAASLLPPEVAAALGTAASAASQAAEQLTGLDPSIASAAVGAGVALPALAIWNLLYGGYAGNLTPAKAAELLQTQEALLVDVRPEAQRLERGIAELKRGALGKGAAVPPVQLLPSVARRVRDPGALALEILAAEVAGLARVNPRSTRVIIMDAQGERSKALARALAAQGVRRAYVLEGGFKGWARVNGVKQRATEYDASPLDAVGDAAESVVEQAAGQLSVLQQPRNAAVAAAAAAAVGALAFNLKTALEFIGVLGVELTIASRVMSYSSPQDALDDLTGLYGAASAVVTAPLKLVDALTSRQQQRQQQQQHAETEA